MNVTGPGNQLMRFVTVGAFNTALSYGIYALGLTLGLDYRVANFISLVAGVVTSFTLQGHFVFKRLEKQRLPRFVFMWLALWVLNISVITVLLPWVNDDAYLAGAMALVIVTAISFLVQRNWVFADKDAR